MNSESLYYFDVQRTMHEAYAHAWEVLHQVNQEELTASITSLLNQNQQMESGEAEREEEDEEEDEEEEEDVVSSDDNSTALQQTPIEL